MTAKYLHNLCLTQEIVDDLREQLAISFSLAQLMCDEEFLPMWAVF